MTTLSRPANRLKLFPSRSLFLAVLFLVPGLICLLNTSLNAADSASRPNIILIMADDLG